MNEYGDEDYPKWLEGVAARVDALASEPKARERFNEMLLKWAKEHEARAPANTTNPMLYTPAKLLPRRAMSLPEKYATLAASHCRICQDTHVLLDPWHIDDEGVHASDDVSVTMAGMHFAVLCDAVPELSDGNQGRIEECLRDVEADLDTDETPSAPEDPASTREQHRATHSSDFTSVEWFGTRYLFSKGNQAQAVCALWEEWERGEHSLTQEAIAKRIESSAERFELAKTFRKRRLGGGYERHPAWGTMIQQASKGSYRLVPSESA